MANFSDITDLEKFQVRTTNSAGTGILYANGVQQVTVFVTVTGLDSEGNNVYLDSTDELQNAIKLIDYNSKQELEKISHGTSLTRWGYTTDKGDYEQLPQASSFSLSTSSDSENVLTFYISCPANETTRTITVAASLTLSNNKTIDTRGSDGFDSHVTINASPAIIYTFANGNLVEKKTEAYSREEQGSSVWGEISNIYLGNINGQAMIMRDNEVYHGETWNYGASNLTDLIYKISAYEQARLYGIYLFHNIRNIFYLFNSDRSGNILLGSGGYTDTFDFNLAPSSFGFVLSRRATYDEDALQGALSAIYYVEAVICTFTDQYGNPGSFHGYPTPVTASDNIDDGGHKFFHWAFSDAS